jgi:tetratricopeptide (TPR) repeat protein
MKGAWLKFLPVVLGIMLLISCKNQGKKVVAGSDNTVFEQPALKEITNKINNDPKNAALYYQRGNILHGIKNDTLAIEDYKKATTLDSTKAEYFSAVGDILFNHRDIAGSVKWIQKAVALNPEDEKAQLKIAKLFLYIQDYPKSFAAINIVMRKNPANPETYFLKGLLYKDMKDTTRSISSFLTSIQMDPDYRESIIELAQLYSQQKNPIALKYYDNAFRLDTTDVFPLFAKGVYYQNTNDWAKAKDEYKDCIIHDGQYPDAYFNMGWILLQQDSVEKAKRQYDLVTKIEPANAGAYYNRGLCSELLNNKQDAIDDYKQALVFNSKYKEAQQGLKRLGAKTETNPDH